MAILTQKNQLRGLTKHEFFCVRLMSRLSKNLYNETQYTIRQHYELNGTFLPYNSYYHILKTSSNYDKLPSQVAQRTMKSGEHAWKSFFALLRMKKKGDFVCQVEKPHFLPKDGYYPCIFPPNQFQVKDGKVRLSLGMWFKKEQHLQHLFFVLPPHIVGKKIKEIRILPRYNARFFDIEYVYEPEIITPLLNTSKYLSIDLGLNNFATYTTSDRASFILEGKGIKSYNRWWNKRKAKLQSQYDIHDVKFGTKMAILLRNRSNVIRNFMAQAVNRVIKECIDHQIGNIVIGELKGIKQHGHLGKNNNQHFQAIPYGLFKQKLQSKCELYGIAYHEVSEVYTSQTCSHCGRVRKANRKYRGLYVCDQCHTKINADVNGSINIGKKVAPNYLEGSSGIVNIPQRITLVTFGKGCVTVGSHAL
jgi:putative transposase